LYTLIIQFFTYIIKNSFICHQRKKEKKKKTSVHYFHAKLTSAHVQYQSREVPHRPGS
jgi:hypothetical protein